MSPLFDILKGIFKPQKQESLPETADLSFTTDNLLIDLPAQEIKPKFAIFEVDDLKLYPPEYPRAEPDIKVEETGDGERRRIASLWNAYGASIKEEADKAGINYLIALAIFAVESGKAFDPETGLIIIRVEPHVFKRYSGKEVSTPHTTQAAEWQSFKEAYTINPEAALKSSSIGLPQMMMFNFNVTRFPTPKEMLLGFQNSCYEQIAGFFGFVKHNKIDGYAQKGDFVSFARRYNGRGKEALYATKMQRYLNHAKDLLEK